MAQKLSLKAKAGKIFALLKKRHSNARIELAFGNPVELLVATILSAQCTDKRVNQVTPGIFKKYRTPRDYAAAPQEELERDIRSLGFFRQKAKSIRAAMAQIVERHGGEVPRDMESLTRLPGVGRKTANVVLGNAFGIPGIVVDTHVIRVSNRLGLTRSEDPEQIERDLMPLVPEKEWTLASHVLVFHGRYLCKARKPMCDLCPVTAYCLFYRENPPL